MSDAPSLDSRCTESAQCYSIQALKDFTLNVQNADAWRRLLLADASSPSLADCSGVTLPGTLELLATAVALEKRSDLLKIIEERAAAGDAVWHPLLSEWQKPKLAKLTGQLHGTRIFEFFRLRAVEDKTSDQFSLFLERFYRSMKHEGFPPAFANALAKVGDEMADNVVQHSAMIPPFSGIAGYHVQEKRAAFSVVDVGRGILASLSGSTWRMRGQRYARLLAKERAPA